MEEVAENIRNSFQCIITAEFFTRPTTTSCGHTFEWAALKKCLAGKAECPKCHAPLSMPDSINYHTKGQIDDLISKFPELRKEQYLDSEYVCELIKKNDVTAIEILRWKDAELNMILEDGATFLIFACKEASDEFNLKLLNLPKINVNGQMTGKQKGITALMSAIWYKKNNTVQKLLDMGAHTNIISETKYTALLAAFNSGNIDAVAKLIAKKQDLEINKADSKGNAAIHYAMLYEIDILKNLLDQGADCNVKDKSGRTALYIASETGDKDKVEHLVSLPNVDLISKASDGTTAQEIAETKSDANVVAIFKQTEVQVRLAGQYSKIDKMYKAASILKDIYNGDQWHEIPGMIVRRVCINKSEKWLKKIDVEFVEKFLYSHQTDRLLLLNDHEKNTDKKRVAAKLVCLKLIPLEYDRAKYFLIDDDSQLLARISRIKPMQADIIEIFFGISVGAQMVVHLLPRIIKSALSRGHFHLIDALLAIHRIPEFEGLIFGFANASPRRAMIILSSHYWQLLDAKNQLIDTLHKHAHDPVFFDYINNTEFAHLGDHKNYFLYCMAKPEPKAFLKKLVELSVQVAINLIDRHFKLVKSTLGVEISDVVERYAKENPFLIFMVSVFKGKFDSKDTFLDYIIENLPRAILEKLVSLPTIDFTIRQNLFRSHKLNLLQALKESIATLDVEILKIRGIITFFNYPVAAARKKSLEECRTKIIKVSNLSSLRNMVVKMLDDEVLQQNPNRIGEDPFVSNLKKLLAMIDHPKLIFDKDDKLSITIAPKIKH